MLLEMNVDKGSIIFLFGLIGVLSCVPRLFAKNDEAEAENSAFMGVVQSDFFKFLTMASLGSALPMIFDFAGGLQFQDKCHARATNNISRFFLCVANTVAPLLYIHFAINQQKLLAVVAVYNMRNILIAMVIAAQYYNRSEAIYSFRLISLTFGLFLTGTVLRTYTVEYSLDDPLHFPGQVCRLLSAFLICLGAFRHFSLYLRGHLKQRDTEWQTLVVELIMALPIVWNMLCLGLDRGKSVYDQHSFSFIGIDLIMSFVGISINAVLTTEAGFMQCVMKEKLAMKRQFVRFISHEVRTPLNSCVLGLNFIMKRYLSGPTDLPTPQEAVELLQDIITSCITAVEFMDNLLLYEKVDSQQLPLYQMTEDIAVLCEDVYRMFFLSAEELNIRLVLNIDPSIRCKGNGGKHSALAMIDKSKVSVVLRNLISNALKFTQRHGAVTCSLLPIVAGKTKQVIPDQCPFDSCTHIRLIISDTGPGMSKEECSQLFSAFVQFSPNELQQGGGSGIGLYISHKIIQEHGLKINVHSVKGEGTSFYIDFPKLAEEPFRHRERAQEIAAAQFPDCNQTKHASIDLSLISVLLVDDSPMNRKMLKRTLKQHNVGGDITEVGDGVELLQKIGAPTLGIEGTEDYVVPLSLRTYDVIIVDNHMPRMGGREAVKRLRQSGYSGIIVGHTGDASPEDLVSFCNAGADITLPKPFDIELFTNFILSRHKSSHEGPLVLATADYSTSSLQLSAFEICSDTIEVRHIV